MSTTHDTQVPTTAEREGNRHGGLLRSGLLATLAAVLATTAAAAIAKAAGVDFELPDGGASIPLGGFGVLTGFFSLVGLALAAALGRWSSRPAEHFVRTAVTLTAVSLVPPFLVGADAATAVALVVLHLLAAVFVVPALARGLRRRTG